MAENKHLHGNAFDLTGQRFGRWTVLGYSHSTPKHHVYWACRCDCGKERAVMSQNLRNGISTSCGCAHREKTAELTYKGETKPLTEWCEIYGLKKKTVYGRLHDYGWTDPTEILFGKGVAI